MTRRIFIVALLLGAIVGAQAQTVPTPETTELQTTEGSGAPTAAVVPANPSDLLSAELASARATLQKRDALIKRLSRHLENALMRLNRAQGPIMSENGEEKALRMIRDQLEQRNNALKAKKEALEQQLADLSKKAQLLDLENRQLFEALNGKPYRHEEETTLAAKPEPRENKDSGLVLGR